MDQATCIDLYRMRLRRQSRLSPERLFLADESLCEGRAWVS